MGARTTKIRESADPSGHRGYDRQPAQQNARSDVRNPEPEDAARLHAAVILYAPDYVINAGGVLQLAGLANLGWDEAELERSLAVIGDTLRGLYRDADANGITPSEAAERLAAARVAAALSSK